MGTFGWKNIEGFDPKTETYVPLDLDGWLERHRIREEGARRGRNDDPHSTQTQPDAVFREIVEWVSNRALQCRTAIVNHINNQLLASLNQIQTYWQDEIARNTIDLEVERHCQKLKAFGDQSTSDLSHERDEFEQASQDFSQFKRDHGLSRVADYPKNQVTHWLWVPVAAIVESFVSANLLGSVSRGGVIEGWTIALVLTLVNVFLGVLTGFVVRQINCSVGYKKVFPVIASLALAFVAMCWNTIAGHVRDVFVAAEKSEVFESTDEAFATAWQTMIETPVPWESLSSAGLAIVGIFVFSLTTYKTYGCDDPFPGYGKKHRQVERLRLRYHDARDKALEELEDLQDKAMKWIEGIQNRHILDKNVWKNTLNRLSTILENYPKNLRQYNRDLAYLLSAYTTANRAERATEPPEFFEKEQLIDIDIMEAPSVTAPDVPEWKDVPDKIKSGRSHIESIYTQLKQKLIEAI